MPPLDTDGIASSADPDQTAVLGAVGSGSALLVQPNLLEHVVTLLTGKQ